MIDRAAAVVAGLVDLVRDHALREQRGDRLGRLGGQVAGPDHRAGEEAGIQQVQDRVLHPADILVHVHPVIGVGRVGGRGRVGRGEAGKIPRGIDKGVHRVRLAPGRAAAAWAGRVAPGRVAVQRVARHVERHVERQEDRQVRLGLGHDPACLAVQHRDRAAPVALARDAPVAQAEAGDAFAVALRLGMGDGRVHRRLASLVGGLVVGAREAAHIGYGIGFRRGERLGRRRRVGLRPRRAALAEGGKDRQPVFHREVVVALVVGGRSHDRAGAVVHQDEVRDPDRQLARRVQRVTDPDAGVDPDLLGFLQRLLGRAGAARLGRDGGDGRVGFKRFRQRMVGADRQEACPHQGVGTGRIDLDPRKAGRVHGVEAQLHPARAADPVGLHQPHLFGPAVQPVERVQKLVRIVRDAEEPLRQLAPLDRLARAPALAVDHLLVGQHRHVHRVPVDHGGLAIDQPGVEHVEKQRLLLGDVIVVAGGELAGPVDRQAQRLHLLLHGGDVGIGPVARVAAVFHRRVLGGHAEGVPAHRMQDAEPLRALVAGHNVAHRIVADVAHVDPPRRIGEHLEHVVFRPLVAPGDEGAGLVPRLLPARFAVGWIIGHGRTSAGGLPSGFSDAPGQGLAPGPGRGVGAGGARPRKPAAVRRGQ